MVNSIGSRVIDALATAELAPTPINYLRTYYALTGQTLGESDFDEISPECLEVLAMAQDVLLLATDHTGTLARDRKSVV